MSKNECEYPDLHGHCEGEVKLRHAMTQYCYTEEDRLNGKEDPNKDFHACEYHWQCYYEYWREMWNEYYSGQGVGANMLPEYSAEDYIDPEVMGSEDEF